MDPYHSTRSNPVWFKTNCKWVRTDIRNYTYIIDIIIGIGIEGICIATGEVSSCIAKEITNCNVASLLPLPYNSTAIASSL
jgi:hypothetical protein